MGESLTELMYDSGRGFAGVEARRTRTGYFQPQPSGLLINRIGNRKERAGATPGVAGRGIADVE